MDDSARLTSAMPQMGHSPALPDDDLGVHRADEHRARPAAGCAARSWLRAANSATATIAGRPQPAMRILGIEDPCRARSALAKRSIS